LRHLWHLAASRHAPGLDAHQRGHRARVPARKAFIQAGFAQNQCRLILGRALEVLPRLSDGTYDMVFCDADTRDYADYLTAALRLLRPGGIVAFNNALLAGAPEDAGGDEGNDDPSLDLASQVRANSRLIPVLLPLGDGLLAAVKRGD
jgi:predicted O-methyltransferase YrrM